MTLMLLVEDNESDEKLALMAMKKAEVSAEIVVARDGQEALDYLFGVGASADGPVRRLPAVTLLDLNLPKIGGLEVLRRMRADERTRRLPVVVLTTSQEQEDIVRACDLGANAFVTKPVGFAEFVRTINAVLVFWLAVNRAPGPPRLP